jgi:hypothetical protein
VTGAVVVDLKALSFWVRAKAAWLLLFRGAFEIDRAKVGRE